MLSASRWLLWTILRAAKYLPQSLSSRLTPESLTGHVWRSRRPGRLAHVTGPHRTASSLPEWTVKKWGQDHSPPLLFGGQSILNRRVASTAHPICLQKHVLVAVPPPPPHPFWTKLPPQAVWRGMCPYGCADVCGHTRGCGLLWKSNTHLGPQDETSPR